MSNKEQVKAFLVERLNEFIDQFPYTKVSYVLDEFDSVFVEVLPNAVYSSDIKYINWENQITDEFLEKFPYLNLAFISDDTYLKFEQWDFQLIGAVYDIPTQKLFMPNVIESSIVDNSNFMTNYNTVFTSNNTTSEYNQVIDGYLEEIATIKSVFKGSISHATELVKKSNEYMLAA